MATRANIRFLRITPTAIRILRGQQVIRAALDERVTGTQIKSLQRIE
jgi:hypothetical protein